MEWERIVSLIYDLLLSDGTTVDMDLTLRPMLPSSALTVSQLERRAFFSARWLFFTNFAVPAVRGFTDNRFSRRRHLAPILDVDQVCHVGPDEPLDPKFVI